MIGSLVVIDSYGKLQRKCDGWPSSLAQALPQGWYYSFKDNVFDTPYRKPGFTTTFGTAHAEIKRMEQKGSYQVYIYGPSVTELHALKELLYKKFGFSEVAGTPSRPILNKWMRLLTRFIREKTRSQKFEAIHLAEVPECEEMWVNLGAIADHLNSSIEELWETYFLSWTNGEAFLMVAGPLGEDFFIGGLDEHGATLDGKTIWGEGKAFYRSLRQAYISKDAATKIPGIVL
jgi:hypothetical protein